MVWPLANSDFLLMAPLQGGVCLPHRVHGRCFFSAISSLELSNRPETKHYTLKALRKVDLIHTPKIFLFFPLNIQRRMAKNPALEFWSLIKLDIILEFIDSNYIMKGTEPGWFLQDHVLSVSSWKQTRQLLIQKAILETCTVFLDNHSASQICQGQSSNKLKPR